MNKAKIISSKLIFKGRAIKLRFDTVIASDGRETTREIVEHTPVVAMVAIDDKNNVLLVQQYREAIGCVLTEIPAGSIDPGEEIETAVRREMQEETGYLPRQLVKLFGFYVAPGYCTEYLYVYLATDLIPSRLVAEDTDEINLVRVPVEEIPFLLRTGKINDAKSLVGLYAFLDYLTKSTKS